MVEDALRHNVRELHRFTGRRLLAVAKNNADGLGVRQVGPILDSMEEVAGLAVVRPAEALALREAGAIKPILMMAHVEGEEAETLVRVGVRLTPFHDDAAARFAELAARTGGPVPVHVFVDTGMHRIGMPHRRAVDWIVGLAASGAVSIEGAYTMFSGAIRDGEPFDFEHMRRFLSVVADVRSRGVDLGVLHGQPSDQIVRTPALEKLDLVRPGGAIYGLDEYRTGPSGERLMDLRPVFRLRAKVVRVEQLDAGEGVSFNHHYRADRPTWIATLPIGHTDGYPKDAAGKTQVLIGDRCYAVIGTVSSNHTVVEIGERNSVAVGDVATLVGPDRVETWPVTVAERGGLGRDYWLITRLNALLPRRVV